MITLSTGDKQNIRFSNKNLKKKWKKSEKELCNLCGYVYEWNIQCKESNLSLLLISKDILKKEFYLQADL